VRAAKNASSESRVLSDASSTIARIRFLGRNSFLPLQADLFDLGDPRGLQRSTNRQDGLCRGCQSREILIAIEGFHANAVNDGGKSNARCIGQQSGDSRGAMRVRSPEGIATGRACPAICLRGAFLPSGLADLMALASSGFTYHQDVEFASGLIVSMRLRRWRCAPA